MSEILYTYGTEAYANITNQCDCSCIFCVRNEIDALGSADNLWHQQDPTLEEIEKAMDDFDFTGYDELVYCGYGEPTCALDNLLASAEYVKEKYGVKIRVNTNGLGNIYNKRDIVPELAKVIDSVSISLNGPDNEVYTRVSQPAYENPFDELLKFIRECKEQIPEVKMTIVDVLTPEETKRCFDLADELGVPLRVRPYAD